MTQFLNFAGGFFPQKRCPDFFSWDIFVGVFLHKEKNFCSPLCLEVNWAFTKFLGTRDQMAV